MNDGYFSWYRAWRFSVWVLHALAGVLTVIGGLAFLFILTQVDDLSWMVYFLPIWFACVFSFFFVGHLIRYKQWDRLKDDQ